MLLITSKDAWYGLPPAKDCSSLLVNGGKRPENPPVHFPNAVPPLENAWHGGSHHVTDQLSGQFCSGASQISFNTAGKLYCTIYFPFLRIGKSAYLAAHKNGGHHKPHRTERAGATRCSRSFPSPDIKAKQNSAHPFSSFFPILSKISGDLPPYLSIAVPPILPEWHSSRSRPDMCDKTAPPALVLKSKTPAPSGSPYGSDTGTALPSPRPRREP